jgi:DNA-binding MarR family transcriptional regulator
VAEARILMPATEAVTREPLNLGFLPDLLGYHLGRARGIMWRDIVRSGEPQMRSGQFTALVLIAENPGISQTQLARALSLDKATIVALIDRLSKSGFVERTTPPNDRRRHALIVTANGKLELAKLRKSRMAHEEKFRALFDASELDALFGYLRRFETMEY